jgi:hypothetical protein
MKTANQKPIDAMDIMLEQREQLSEKLSKMSKEEIVDYFRKKEPENPTMPAEI